MQAGHATAQTTLNITTLITALSLTDIQPSFGQLEGYGTEIQVPTGAPNPPGGIVSFLNGTTTLVTANVAVLGPNVTVNGNSTV